MVFDEGVRAPAAGPYDELADAACAVQFPRGSLRCEALVVVVVAREDHVRSGCIEVRPERADRRIVAVWPRAEAGMVPVRERAEVAVGGEVGAQPALLRRTPCAADDRAVAVQDDDVPRAEGVRVPPCQ